MDTPHFPHELEDRYFAAEDIEKRLKIALQLAEEARERERAELKRLHYNHCPRCGVLLKAGVRGSFAISACPQGHGAWLDPPELRKIKPSQPFAQAVTTAALNLFKRRSFWEPGQ